MTYPCLDLRHSENEIEFLDVLVKLRKGNIQTDLFSKPTDSKAYLHFLSDHPAHTKNAVPLGLAKRLKRICSNDDDYMRHKKELKTRLLKRGYPNRIIDSSFRKADNSDRLQLLQGREHAAGALNRVPWLSLILDSCLILEKL